MRVAIPPDIAAEVMFRHWHTCCVCNVRGKTPLQIHHIDEDHSNSNDIENLAVLCGECHEKTMLRGGFGRKLNAGLVIKYRDAWVKRVADIKRSVDDLMIEKLATAPKWLPEEPLDEGEARGDLELMVQIDSIPDRLKKGYQFAQPHWDSGVTGEMVDATMQLTQVISKIWVEVARFYPPNHFGKRAEAFVDEYISGRYELHRRIFELDGMGTIVNTIIAHSVLVDMQELLKTTCDTLLMARGDSRVPPGEWRNRFDEAVTPAPIEEGGNADC